MPELVKGADLRSAGANSASVRIRQLAFFLFIFMKHKQRDLEKDENGFTIMNEKNLLIICERDDLFSYPEMNEKLYLHYKGKG